MINAYDEGDEPVPGFRLTSYLGGGEFSNVWKATAPGGAEAAIKIVNLMSNQTLKEFRSLRLLRRIRHPHIVPLMAFWLKDYQGRLLDDRQFDESISQKRRPAQLVIAMGLGDKSLADRLRECRSGGDAGIGPGELLRFLEDAARGIDYLNQPIHDLGAGPVAIQHCDIKPQNILIVGGAAQVCDLGVVRVVGDPRSTAAVGSAAYMAPEIIIKGNPSEATDQYALAITYYELRTGRLPFDAPSSAGAYFAHLQGKLDFSLLPEADRAVLARATAMRPEDRFPSCLQMVHTLINASRSAEVAAPTPGIAQTKQPELLELGKASCSLGTKQSAARPPTEIRGTGARPATMYAEEECPFNEGAHYPTRQTGSGRLHPDLAEVAVGRAGGQRTGRRWRRIAGPLILLVALGLGSLGAWLTRSPGAAATISPPGDSSNPEPVRQRPEPFVFRSPPDRVHSNSPMVASPFMHESNSRAFRTLEEAIAEAQEGETISIHSNGPFVTGPLDIRGKSLTLKAGTGFRPVFQRTTRAVMPGWQPLFASNRDLTIQGLELRSDEGEIASSPTGPAYLISSQQASLRLIDCRLLMPHGSAAIVGRQSHLVELRGCSVAAHALALCVEVGGAPCAIQLTGNSICIQDPAAAAISVFGSADIHQPAGVQLRLESNVVSAGRLAGFKALTGGLQMEARNNEFTFAEALLSFVAYPSSSSWRSGSSWRGLENHYLGTADWLQVEGRSLGIHDLTEWQAFWASPETGSLSAPPGSRLSFSMRPSDAKAP